MVSWLTLIVIQPLKISEIFNTAIKCWRTINYKQTLVLKALVAIMERTPKGDRDGQENREVHTRGHW